MSDRPIISTATYNHHHKTIKRLVNKHSTRFQSKQKGNPELSRNIIMCYRRNPSLRYKLAKTRYIYTRIGNTNKPTHTKTSLHKQMLEQKMAHMPQHSNKTPIPKHRTWNNTHN